MLILNHHINEEGEGEPSDKEEIIAEHYDKKLLLWFIPREWVSECLYGREVHWKAAYVLDKIHSTAGFPRFCALWISTKSILDTSTSFFVAVCN